MARGEPAVLGLHGFLVPAEFFHHGAERPAHAGELAVAVGLGQEREDVALTDAGGGRAHGAQTALEARGENPAEDAQGNDEPRAEAQNELAEILHGGESVGHWLADDDEPALTAIVAETA